MELVRPKLKELNDEINSAGRTLSVGDFTCAHEILGRLNESSAAVAEFSENPKKYIEGQGFVIPTGIEGVYYIDKQGVTHPHPHDKPSSGQGSRVVAEVYMAPGTIGWCVICLGCVNL